MDNLEPITRNEMFLNGDDLEPITREEMILAGADLEPITRHEWFLKKYRGGGGGGGYDLVNIPNLPADIASFNDGTDLPMASLKVSVTPYQDLHGQDAPWAGGSGKNKLQVTAQSKTQEGITYTVNDDGTITVSGTATGYSSLAIGKARVSSSMGNVTISGIADVTNIMWAECNVLDENNQLVVNITGGSQYPSITFDLSNYPNAYYLLVTVKRNSNSTTSGTIKPQVEVGSTATSFAPYSNICPIIGWDEAVVTRCGKNLYSHNGISIYDYAFSQQIAFSQMRNPIFMKGGQKYVLSLSENITLFRMRAFDKFQNLVTNASIVNAHNQGSGTGLVFYANGNFFGYNGAGVNSITTFQPTEDIWFDMTVQTTSPSQVMFETGDTPSTYEAYNGATYTIDLDGTRYGGVLDATNGVLTVTYAKIALADIGKSKYATYQYGVRTITNFFDSIPNSSLLTGMSNTFVLSNSNESYDVDRCSILFGSGSAKTSILISTQASGLSADASITEIDEWLRSIDAYIVYPLATPITVQLAPQPVKSIEGENNISANCGQITEVKYFKKA